MTTREIQRRIIVERYRRAFVLPNFTPRHWFECDVFELTKSGFFTEYEIKISASDFYADATKVRGRLTGEHPNFERVEESKHSLLASNHQNGPTRFFFVIAASMTHNGSLGIVPVVRIPEWAGLIHATPNPNRRAPHNVSLTVIRSAPRLHTTKIDPKVKEHAQGIAYWRFQSLFLYGKEQPQLELNSLTV